MLRWLGASGGMMALVAMVTSVGNDRINVPDQARLVRSTK